MGKKEIEDSTEKFGKSKKKSCELMLLFPYIDLIQVHVYLIISRLRTYVLQ